jgi:hypothetical protein
MRKSNSLPESFAGIEDAAEFWDGHSTADDWDQTHEVGFEIALNPRHRVVLASDLAEELRLLARQQGVSVETLVNLWLQERIRRPRDTIPQLVP